MAAHRHPAAAAVNMVVGVVPAGAEAESEIHLGLRRRCCAQRAQCHRAGGNGRQCKFPDHGRPPVLEVCAPGLTVPQIPGPVLWAEWRTGRAVLPIDRPAHSHIHRPAMAPAVPPPAADAVIRSVPEHGRKHWPAPIMVVVPPPMMPWLRFGRGGSKARRGHEGCSRHGCD